MKNGESSHSQEFTNHQRHRSQPLIKMQKGKVNCVKVTPASIFNTIEHSDARFECKKDASGENERSDCVDITTTDLFKFLSPLIFCLKISGLYFIRSNGVKLWQNPWFIYSIVYFIFLCLNAIRASTVYVAGEQFGPLLFFKFQMNAYSFDVAGKSLIMITAWYSKEGFRQLFIQWSEVCGNKTFDRVEKRFVLQAFMVVLLYTVLNPSGSILAAFTVPDLETMVVGVTWPGALDMENKLPPKLVLAFLTIATSGMALLPVSVMWSLCFVISRRFSALNAELGVAVDRGNTTLNRIEEFRMQHQRLSLIVDIIDRIFSPLIAISYLSNIPMFCVLLYNLLNSNLHYSQTLLNLFWIVFLVFHLATLSIMTASVNVAVRSIYLSISYISHLVNNYKFWAGTTSLHKRR